MCLYVDQAHTKKMKARLKQQGKIIAYKVVSLEKSWIEHVPDRLCSMFHTFYTWHAGWNKSGRVGYPFKDADRIGQGIHVYLRRDTARKTAVLSKRYKLIRVVCFASDFVASMPGRAVFDKVWLSQEQYYCAGMGKKKVPAGIPKASCPEVKVKTNGSERKSPRVVSSVSGRSSKAKGSGRASGRTGTKGVRR